MTDQSDIRIRSTSEPSAYDNLSSPSLLVMATHMNNIATRTMRRILSIRSCRGFALALGNVQIFRWQAYETKGGGGTRDISSLNLSFTLFLLPLICTSNQPFYEKD